MYPKIIITKPVFKDIKYSTGDFPVILTHDTTENRNLMDAKTVLIYCGK